MMIDKAIKIGTLFEAGKYPGDAMEFREMVSLGIEALKRVKSNRSGKVWHLRQWCYPMYPQPTVYPLLPGETEK